MAGYSGISGAKWLELAHGCATGTAPWRRGSVVEVVDDLVETVAREGEDED